jgi:hypothetical protein
MLLETKGGWRIWCSICGSPIRWFFWFFWTWVFTFCSLYSRFFGCFGLFMIDKVSSSYNIHMQCYATTKEFILWTFHNSICSWYNIWTKPRKIYL